MKIGILGGGLTGLTIASNLNPDYEILEKNQEIGGLCRSFSEKGFTFDYGGAHILYSKDQNILEYIKKILGKNISKGIRNNKIYFKKKFIKYPFENGLGDLNPQDRFECLYYYLKRSPKKRVSNLENWCYSVFGKGIAEKYLIPYNQKIWKYPLKNMSVHWVERIPNPPLADIIKSAVGIPTEGYQHQLNFYYPNKGGINALVKILEKRVSGIFKNVNIKKIEKSKEKWLVKTEKTIFEYNKIISTIPLFELFNYLENVPQKINKALKQLKYNSLITVMLGVNQKELSDFTAIYFPQKELLFHRIAFPKVFSKNNVPTNKSSIVAEITTPFKGKIWQTSDKEILKRVVQGLEKTDIINKKKICYTKIKRIRYAYVVYNRDYQKNIKIIKNYMKKIGIELCGRFAEFEYLNMDACIKSGLKLAKQINKIS